jgi:hypothetical protein
MGSIVFVHGTGVRLPSYKSDFENVRKIAQSVGIQDQFIPCAWGDPLGVDFQGKSLPGSLANSAQERAEIERQQQDDNQWKWLFDAPLLELDQFTIPDPDASSEFLPPGSKSKGQQAWETIRAYQPSPELIGILDRANLKVHWPAAWNEIVDSPIAKEAFEASSHEIPEVCRALARALVAQLHRIAVSSGMPGPYRSVRDKLVERLVEDWGQKTLGFGSIVWDLVSRLGTPLLRSYRDSISNLSALAIGDVLLYQTRGQEIRDFIRAKIESKDTKPPVTLVAHSLGGIACVDLLAMPNPPKVEKLITAGSQSPFLYELGALASRLPGESLPKGFPPWLNFYDRNDFLSYIAKPFWPEVIDHEVRSGQPFPDSHGAYFGSEDVWTRIREFMQ